MIGRILLATDGSPASLKAEQLAVQLARSFQARILAVAVVHVANEEERGDNLAIAMERMTALKRRVQDSGILIESRVLKGPVADTIVAAARDEQADVIVLGTHSRQGLAHAFLGSTAEKVVRNADRTVIVAK